MPRRWSVNITVLREHQRPNDTAVSIEVVLRREAPPPSTMLVVHFGDGRDVDQLIINSIGNYRMCGSVLSELGIDGAGSLTLSVLGIRAGVTLGELLRGPGARWSRYGTATVAGIKEAGFDLWPTGLFSDGAPAPYSAHHFDIPIPGCDSATADGYPFLTRDKRKAVRDRFRRPFEELLQLFEPRQRSEYAAAGT